MSGALFGPVACAQFDVGDDGLAPLVASQDFDPTDLVADEANVMWGPCASCNAVNGCNCANIDTAAFTNSANPFPTVNLTGFFQVDAAWFETGLDTRFNDDFSFSNVLDSRGFRRARLAAQGQTAKNVDYMIEFDFAFPGRPTFMDLYFDVHGLPFGSLRVGQWRQPFGLGELTSVRSLTFHERASMFFLGPFRRTAIGIHNSNQRSTYAVSLYGGNFNNHPDPFGTSNGDSNYGIVGRVTTLLWDTPGQLLHLGAGYTHTQLDDRSSFFVTFVPPEIVGAPGNFFSAEQLQSFIGPATENNVFNSELAMVNGPLHIESELRFSHFGRVGDDALVPAFYAQAGYFLTGESRSYDRSNGVMGGVQPKRPFNGDGWGAWELAARYSHLDFNGDELLDGRTNNFLVGLNWYLNENTKFQFNYLKSMIDRISREDTSTAYSIRAQVAF